MIAARTPFRSVVCWLALLASASASASASGSASGVVGHVMFVAASSGKRVVRDVDDVHSKGGDGGGDTPTMTSWHVSTDVLYRYAKSSLATRLVNPASVAKEISFSAVLPQAAFISAFHIEMDGRRYDAYVKEKEAANREYQSARDSGHTAATVVKARDSNVFTVSVNVEAAGKVTFNLTYEELLTRRDGLYHHVVSIDPGQIVADMSLRVRIEETAALSKVNVPPLRTSNEIGAADGDVGGAPGPTTITRPTPEVAVVEWTPSADEQRLLRADGVRGQLVVQYDVERDNNAAQILMSDGYFVHFYAPTTLTPLRKHVVFVLDVSGSMDGAKMAQLREAMIVILGELAAGDAFSIVLFESNVEVWRPLGAPLKLAGYHSELPLSGDVVVDASADNVALAKTFVTRLVPLGGTNIHDALMTALDVVKLGRRTLVVGDPEPLVIFLTDGQANVGAFTTPTDIVRVVTAKNKRRTPVFCLAFGRNADLGFLKRLALANAAFARLIYEAGDAALQLRDFYRQVASVLLANVTFHYEPEQVANGSLTQLHFPTLFAGGELVVAGRLAPAAPAPSADEVGAAPARLRGEILAKTATGDARIDFPPPLIVAPAEFQAPQTPQVAGFMERLWAHLTVLQLLDKERADGDPDNSTGRTRALELALKYSFVTSLTSLVVVKPNATATASDPVEAAAGGRDRAFMARPKFSSAPSRPAGSSAKHRNPSAYGARPSYKISSHGGQRLSTAWVSSTQDLLDLRSSFSNGNYNLDRALASANHGFSSTTPPQPSTTPGAARATGAAGVASVQLALDDLTWAAGVKNGTHVFVTKVAVDGTTVTIAYPIGERQDDVSGAICPSNGGVSYCRHLPHCVLPAFKDDFNKYVSTYFCNIDGFAGVCCPSSHPSPASAIP